MDYYHVENFIAWNQSFNHSTSHHDNYDYLDPLLIKKQPMNSLLLIGVSIVYILMFVIGLIGNCFTIAVLLFWLDMSTTTNILVLNLAVADLSYVAWLPVLVDKILEHRWKWGDIPCKLYYMSSTVNQFGSIQFLTALCIDRYLAVCHPIRSRRIRTARNALITAASCWLLVIALTSPVLAYARTVGILDESMFIMANNSSNGVDLDSLMQKLAKRQCLLDWNVDSRRLFSMCTFALAFCMPMGAMWCLYLLTCRKLSRQNSRLTSVCRNAGRSRRTRRISFVVIGLVLFYSICWIPYWVVQLLLEYWAATAQMGKYHDILHILALTSYTFQYANSALNPYIFLILNRDVTDAMQRPPNCCHHKKRNSATKQLGCLNDVTPVPTGTKGPHRSQPEMAGRPEQIPLINIHPPKPKIITIPHSPVAKKRHTSFSLNQYFHRSH